MKRLMATLATGAGCLTAGAAVWDNFPGDTYDTGVRLTAERNTQVGQSPAAATWSVDDATFEVPVFVNSIEWIGIREVMGAAGVSYTYSLADFAIFTRMIDDFGATFATVESGTDVDWVEVESLGPVNFPGQPNRVYEAYRGRIDFVDGGAAEDALQLAAGEYWFGTRLVGDAGNFMNGGTGGRNFLAAGSGAAGSVDEGYNYDLNFNPFVPWGPASQRNPFTQNPVEFAYRIDYTPVPEPTAALGLLVLGTICVRNSRTISVRKSRA